MVVKRGELSKKAFRFEMMEHDTEATVDLSRLIQTWTSRRDCPGSAGVPPAVGAFQAAWGQARGLHHKVVVQSPGLILCPHSRAGISDPGYKG